jgi:hypothetical protein
MLTKVRQHIVGNITDRIERTLTQIGKSLKHTEFASSFC